MRALLVLSQVFWVSVCLAAGVDSPCAPPPADWPEQVCLDGKKVNCQSPRNANEEFLCLSSEGSKIENDLDRLHQRSLLALELAKVSDADRKELLKVLTEAQRSWYQYRKLHCLAVGALSAHEELADRARESALCEIDLGRKRVNELKALQPKP